MPDILLINWRDIKNPEAGGAEVYYHEIFSRLVALTGWQVTLLCHAWKGAPAEERIDGIRVLRRGPRSLFNVAAAVYLLRHPGAYSCVIEDLNKIPFFTPLYYRGRRHHLVMHFFGTTIFAEANPLAALYVFLQERLVPLVYRHETFTAISQSTRSDIEHFSRSPRAVGIVEPGIDTGFYYPSQPKSAYPLLVYIGRLKKYKRVQMVIDCLNAIRRKVPDTRLVVAGNGDYLPQLKRLAHRRGVAKEVDFSGYVTEEQKRDLLSRAWLVVNPSVKEGWGITNIEAALCGTPSLSSNVHGLRDSVQNGRTGLLFELRNTQDFIVKTVGLLQDTSRRVRMEQAACEFGARFDWQTVAGRMVDELTQVLQEEK